MKKEFFVSGRTELAGNHTDHQNGRILAAAIALGIRAKVSPNDQNVVRVHSEGHGDLEVRLGQLSVRTREFATPQALVRGMLAGFQGLGLKIGGFDCTTTGRSTRWSSRAWRSRRRTAISASPAA